MLRGAFGSKNLRVYGQKHHMGLSRPHRRLETERSVTVPGRTLDTTNVNPYVVNQRAKRRINTFIHVFSNRLCYSEYWLFLVCVQCLVLDLIS